MKHALASLYISGRNAAAGAAAAVGAAARGPAPLVLVNPGAGPLASELLRLRPTRLLLYEPALLYRPELQLLKDQNPDIVDFYFADFFATWKLAYQDNMDRGNRIEKLLKNIKPYPWGPDVSMKVIGAVPSNNFIKHLIVSIVNQNNIISMGRPEFYLAMLPLDYYTLIVDVDAPFNISSIYHYRQTPVMFNLLFDHKLLTKLPREDFSPSKIISSPSTKSKTGLKLTNIDKEYLYFVHITPKINLPCKLEHLQLFSYFLKHHLHNKNNRIIPMLEQWIPGCGVWLITGQDPVGSNAEIGPDENNASLPHITIFTQFSELTPQQKLTLFKKFISWPEFELSPFREVVDNYINKSFGNSEQDLKIDNIESEEEIKDRVEIS